MTARGDRLAVEFSDIISNHCIAMQAAVIDAALRGDAVGMAWIRNTLCGPGLLPDIDAARALGGAQAWFDAKTAEHEAWRAANPGPGLNLPVHSDAIDALRSAQNLIMRLTLPDQVPPTQQEIDETLAMSGYPRLPTLDMAAPLDAFRDPAVFDAWSMAARQALAGSDPVAKAAASPSPRLAIGGDMPA